MAENQVSISSADRNPNYLSPKLQAGNGIALSNNGNFIRIDALGETDHKIAVDNTDNNPNYLSSKLEAGSGITLTDTGSTVKIGADVQTGDHKVSVDSADSSPDYLDEKIKAGTNVTITNQGTYLEIASTDTGMLNPMTSAGDLIVGGVSGNPDRLGVGTNGQVLTVSSGTPSWASIPTQTGDHKVAVNSSDSSPDYLFDKIEAGTNISTSVSSGKVKIDAATQTGDHKVVVDSSDTNPQYLGNKLKAGVGVNISYYNHDKMEIASLGQVKVALLGTMDYLGNKILQGSGITLTKTDNDITIAADTQTGDHKVSTDGTDTANYLENKIEAGTNVSITKSLGKLVISSTDTGMLNPMTDVGDLIIGGASGAPTRLAKGYQGQVLKVGASSLEWSADTGFANPMEERGDLIVGTYDGVASRLPIGTVNQFLFSNGTTAEWATLPLNIDWFVNPGLTNGDFNQVIDRTFYVRMYPSMQMRAIANVAMILSGAVAADVIRVAVYDNARTMVAYGESTGSSSTFRRVNLTQLQPWTPGTNDLYYLGVSIHASSNSSTKFKTATVTSPSYCWYEDVALTSGRAMPATSSLTASTSKVPIIGLRGR